MSGHSAGSIGRRNKDAFFALTRAFAGTFFCVIFPSFSQEQQPTDLGPTLRIDPTPVDANSTASFNIKPLGKVPYSSIAQDSLIDAQMKGSFRAEVDRASMKTDSTSRIFSFQIFLNSDSQFSQSVYAYKIEEDPTGVFNDTSKSINLYLTSNGSLVDSGNVVVPLHSPYGPTSAFDTTDAGKLTRSLNTGSPTTVTIHLKSNLQKLGLSLGVPTGTASCGLCLQSISVQPSTNQLPPDGGVDLLITTVPNLRRALASNSSETLNLVIPVTPAGGIEWPQSISAPFQFSPPRTFVGLSVLGGVLFGAVLRAFLLLSSQKWQWREFFLGAIVGFLTWLIAVFLWKGDSTVKLFGMTFDPTQILPALVLCTLAGGGPALLKLLDIYFPQLGNNTPKGDPPKPAPPHVDDTQNHPPLQHSRQPEGNKL